jgi:hypothetical protein
VAYCVLHSYGALDENLPKERFHSLLVALPELDGEHRIVGVWHEESGICVAIRGLESAALLSVDDPTFPERRASGLGVDETLQRLFLAADGDLEKFPPSHLVTSLMAIGRNPYATPPAGEPGADPLLCP